MIDKQRRPHPRRGGQVSAFHLGLAVVGIALASGCDHRIGLDEFLAMEQARRDAEQPTAEPPTAQMAAAAFLDEQLGPYKIGSGDVLFVTLSRMGADGAQPLAMQVRVDRQGEIKLSQVGKLKVEGMELEDIEDLIEKAYVPDLFVDLIVHVALAEADVTDVLVVGPVMNPGLVSLRRSQRNLLYALVQAGGVSDVASGEVTLRRVRRPTEEVTLNLTDPIELKAALALEPLEDGDILTAHAATPNTVFVGGLVQAPRPQQYPRGVEVTVLQALAGSSGLRTDVTPREATLIRRMPTGEDVHVKLNLDRITTGKDPNITLAAGDILWVPDTAETVVQDWINRNIFIRGGVSANVNYNVTGIEYLNRRSQQSSQFGGSGFGLEQAIDPFGFLLRNQAISRIPTGP